MTTHDGMPPHDFEAEAREYAKRIPDPPPPANVIPFRRPNKTRVTSYSRPPRRPEPPPAA